MKIRTARTIARCSRQSGLSLVEILVASALLAVIMLGLMAMFGQTQRAYQGNIRQVDVLEGARAAIDMLTRDLEHASVTHDEFTVNLHARTSPWIVPVATIFTNNTELIQDFFFLSGEYNRWEGIGYMVAGPQMNAGIGTLYRYSTNVPFRLAPQALSVYQTGVDAWLKQPMASIDWNQDRFRRVINGVVHLRLWPYDAEGNLLLTESGEFFHGQNVMSFSSNMIPAYIQLEIGIAEPQLVEQIAALPNDPDMRRRFLSERTHQIHVFRQQIPIRIAPNE